MHAVIVRVTLIDPEAAIRELREEIVPRVSEAPGLVAGYWTRKENSGSGMIVFDSEDAANAWSERLQAMAIEGDRLVSAEVGEVVANV